MAGIQVNVESSLSTAVIGGVKVEVTRDSDVTVYTDKAVQTRPKAPVTALTKEGVDDMQVSIAKDFNAVALHGARVELAADGSLIVHTNGKVKTAPAPANDSLAQKALEVGDRLRDGTVCIAVDLKKNSALFAPAGIFGGKAMFDKQHEIPAQLNKQNAHGHSDWRNITDDEGRTLSQVWDRVVPDDLKGRAAPWFWIASSYGGDGYGGRVRRGGEADWGGNYRGYSLSVPVVRSGPAVM